MKLPRYPILIPSKGRADNCKTAKLLQAEGVPFLVVVEPQEEDAYAAAFPGCVVVLPFSNVGCATPASTFCKEWSYAAGHARHWQMDDNLRAFREWTTGKGLKCSAAHVLTTIEDFVDEYENLALVGLRNGQYNDLSKPFRLNKGCCWCILVDNSMPLSWRGTTAHDIDFSLQVLTSGRCTALFSLYTVDKTATTTMKGGHSETVYKGDGRIHSARGLQKRWPQMIGLKRTAGMPRHVPIQGLWTKFNYQVQP